jgi:hypothetical protein
MSPKASLLLLASAISGSAVAATQAVATKAKTDEVAPKAAKSVVEGIAVDVSAIDSSATFGTFPMHN